ncbi:DUF2076 domain-containing protein [Polaromonas naphthalenivorans]|nr:DUF2076 family protein [Polaromonas naphthalenivorans]
MNLQEREQLTTFLQQLAQARAGVKDEEAQAMIASTFARQPDAAYLVVQRALLLDAALQDAQAQITQLKAQLAQQRPAPAASSFLDATTWGRQPSPAFSAPVMSSPPVQAVQAVQPAAFAPPVRGFQAPGFLSNMATTAAGVAAGAFLFQGINSLVGGHHNSPLAGASPLSSPAADKEAPANNFLDAPTDTSSSIPDSSAGFSELLDIGGSDDSSDWT